MVGLNDMLEEAADIALHISPPFLPLLSAIQYTKVISFPLSTDLEDMLLASADMGDLQLALVKSFCTWY